jgi:hypothetical protein
MAISLLRGMAKWVQAKSRNGVDPQKYGRPAYWRFWLEQLEKRELLSTFTVINTNDSGAGSLRAAISAANASIGNDTIAFNIPGAGVHTIQPLSALPAITDPLTIDGGTQPGYTGTPLIQLDGSLAGSSTFGLNIVSGAIGSSVFALAVNNFSSSGISFDCFGPSTVAVGSA